MKDVPVSPSVKSVCNFRNARKIAFFIMLLFSAYHGLLIVSRPGECTIACVALTTTIPGGYLCKSLLSDGSAGPDGRWRPSGCMTHLYSRRDTQSCVDRLAPWTRSTRFYFVGDSRLLVLFHAFTRHLEPNWNHSTGRAAANLSLEPPIHLVGNKFTLCFFHYDEVTSEVVELFNSWNETLQNVNGSSHQSVESSPENVCFQHPPTHLVISMATGIIRRYKSSPDGLVEYRRQVEALTGILLDIKLSRVVWMLQDPVAEGLLSEEHKLMTNKEIDEYNSVAERVIQQHPEIEQWRSNRLIAQRMGFPAVALFCSSESSSSTGRLVDARPSSASSFVLSTDNASDTSASVSVSPQASNHSGNLSSLTLTEGGARGLPYPVCNQPPALSDGFHVSDEAMTRNVQVLLNLYCNNQMNYPDGTCCRSPEPITPTQKRFFLFVGTCIVVTFACFLYDRLVKRRRPLSARKPTASGPSGLANGSTVSIPPDNYPPVANGHTASVGLLHARQGCGPVHHWPTGSSQSERASGGRGDRSASGGSGSSTGSSSSSTFEEFYQLMLNLSSLGLILVYFFVCDRTAFFMNTNKGYTTMSFILPLAYCLILGIFFCGSTNQTRLAHIDVTREWKGWMQVYLLIYHFTGSYRVRPLFIIARVLISAYLFLSGFGHFHFMWFNSCCHTSGLIRPPSLLSLCCKLVRFRLSVAELCAFARSWWLVIHRHFDVMFRLNFFVLTLCLVMNRDYLFYYFMPLVSFWFTVTLLLVATGPQLPLGTTRFVPRQGAISTNNSPVLSARRQATGAVPVDCSNVHLSHNNSYYNLLPGPGAAKPSVSPVCSGCALLSPSQTVSSWLPPLLRPPQEDTKGRHSPQWRTHHKALSVGTLYDLRSWRLGDTEPPSRTLSHPISSPAPPLPPPSPSGWEHGPPWTDRLMRRSLLHTIGCRAAQSAYHPYQMSVHKLAGLGLRRRGWRRFFHRLPFGYLFVLVKLGLLLVAVELLHRHTSGDTQLRRLLMSGALRHLFEPVESSGSEQQQQRQSISTPFEDGWVNNHGTWFYHWSIDRYTAIFGMLFALLCNWTRYCGLLTDSVANSDGDLGWPTTSSDSCASGSSLGTGGYCGVGNGSSRSDSFACRCGDSRLGSPHPEEDLFLPPPPVIDTHRRSSSACLEPASLHTRRASRQPIPSLSFTDGTVGARAAGGLFDQITCRRFSSLLLTGLGLLVIAITFIVALYCDDVDVCNDLHTYLCFVPIVAFILARNCLGSLRRHYSVIFAWLGDISLELSVAQCHIWMSADARGILVLLPGYPLVNLALTSFIFVCICYEVNRLTNQLRGFIVPPELVLMLRNLFLFGLVLYLITRSEFVLTLLPGGEVDS